MRRPTTLPAVAAGTLILAAFPALAQDGDWPNYGRTLKSDRFAPQTAITPDNVAGLTEKCRYDLGRQTSFQTGPIVVDGIMYVTTDYDTIALDADTCAEVWRTIEDYEPGSPLKVNRGAALMDGRIFRGTLDGRILAYDVATGKRLWEQTIADPKRAESVPTALLAWDGMVYGGNAGGDNKGVKGRMYGLDAATGEIVWEQYMVPKTKDDPSRGPSAPPPDVDMAATWGNAEGVPITGGASWTSYSLDPETGILYYPGGNPAPDFKPGMRPGANLFAGSMVGLDAKTGAYMTSYRMVDEDFHDWDVSAAPALFKSRDGRSIMASAIKDGYLRLYDTDSGSLISQVPITTIENAAKPLTPEGVRFCPGTLGGAEWNGAAYSPDTNLVYTGAVDWCSTVRVAPDAEVASVSLSQPWSGMDGATLATTFGEEDDYSMAGGWVYAHDADSGETVWRMKMPKPVLSGVTPTAGGVVFVGDMAGTLYALDAATGEELKSIETGGALGGGIVSYEAGGGQRIAAAVGMVSPLWQTAKVNAQVVIYALPE